LDLYNTINENSEEFFGGLRFPASAEKSISKLDADFQSVNERVNHKTVSYQLIVIKENYMTILLLLPGRIRCDCCRSSAEESSVTRRHKKEK
jgi:hypothetical protein